jgi:hypothetical protein
VNLFLQGKLETITDVRRSALVCRGWAAHIYIGLIHEVDLRRRRRIEMRLLALLATALLAVCFNACGGTDKPAGSGSQVASNTTGGGGSAKASSGGTSTGPLLNDGDNDEIGDGDGDNSADNDNDPKLDYKPDENNRYYDPDDRDLLAYGRTATVAEGRAIAAIVRRYFKAAAMENGVAACAQLTPRLGGAVLSDYGQHGPSYLRSGRTCAEVMGLMFMHNHSELAAPIAVTGVRMIGSLIALALLGSRTMPAGYITVHREGGAWKIAQVLNGKIA